MGVPQNVDPNELTKFDDQLVEWWDPEGASRALHDLNPARLGYVEDFVGLRGSRVVDIGCGGGLLTEALARKGASVVGVDAGEGALNVARRHAAESGLDIDYRLTTAEEFAEIEPAGFDAVTCMELLEHVPQPDSVVEACARLVRPGGWCLFATINRTPKAWALAIVGAEYIAGILRRGTHEYEKLIRPSELAAWTREAGLTLADVSGLHYNPLTRNAWVGSDPGVNYLAAAQRPEA